MATPIDVMRQRALMGTLSRLAPLVSQPTAQANMPQTPQAPTGFRGLLARPGVQQGLLAASSALLQQRATPGGTLAGGLAQALPAFSGAMQQGQQEAELDRVISSMPPAMQAIARGLNMPQRAAFVAQAMEQPDRFVIAGNNIADLKAIESGEGQFFYSPSSETPRTTDERNYEAAVRGGYTGTFVDFMSLRRPTTTVNLNNETQERLQESDFKLIDQFRADANAAESQMNNLAILDQLMAQDPSLTGLTEEFMLPLRQIGMSLGMGDDELASKVGAQETFQAIANRMALIQRSELMAGQLSDRDVRILQSTAAQLGKSTAGNRLLIDIQRRLARRAIDKEAFLDDYISRNGSTVGWRSAWREWVNDPANDILSDVQAPPEATAVDEWDSLYRDFGGRRIR